MASNARFENQSVVNSFNIFVDTDRISICEPSNRGDRVNVHLEGNTIIAGDGELIRMTLTSFDMYNNFYTLDRYNSKLKFLHKGGKVTTFAAATEPINGPGKSEKHLPFKNYGSLFDLALEFAVVTAKQIAERSNLEGANIPLVRIKEIKNVYIEGTTKLESINASAADVTAANMTSASFIAAVNTGTKLTLGQTSNKLLDITFETRNGAGGALHNHGITEFSIQCVDENGDAGLIFGAERFDYPYANSQMTSSRYPFITGGANGTLGSSFLITAPTTSTIRVQGYFPMQLSSDPFVYLRSTITQSGGLETAGMSNALINNTSSISDVTSSDIFAKIRRDTHFCTYITTNDEFFINVQQRKISSIFLNLTDSKNRPIGQPAGNENGTAAGLIVDETATLPLPYSGNQDNLGNLSFSCVIRVDIIKVSTAQKLESTPLPLPLPARKAQQGVIFGLPDYGMAKSGN